MGQIIGVSGITFHSVRALLLVAATVATGPALAQAPSPAPPVAAAGAAPSSVRTTEGTEMLVRFDEGLSSGRNSQGDKFSISLDDSVDLGGGVILPAGFSGRGEVTAAQKKGFMGQAGELNVRLEYIRVGETRIRLRASKGGEGRCGCDRRPHGVVRPPWIAQARS